MAKKADNTKKGIAKRKSGAAVAKKPAPTCKKCGGKHWPSQPCNKDTTGLVDNAVEEKLTPPNQPHTTAKKPVSKTIQKMARSPANLPGESPLTSLAISAKDIMQKDLLWAGPDDTVQHALTNLNQNKVGYVMVGSQQVLEGIVSKSDLTGALSPYLRPEFAKWHRPMDDATLQIKLKWIMSKPVCTVPPDTSLAAVMENMCHSTWRALPVVDQQGKVHGLITVFDIFKALLKLTQGPTQ